MTNEIKTVKIKDLIKAKWNYKTDGKPEVIQKLINSATYQKSIGVIAVRRLGKKYEVIDGNHRLDALIEMKVKETKVEDFGVIPKGQAVLIAKQRNTLWFEDDVIKFAELFKNDILKGYEIKELEKMLPESIEDLEGYEKLLDFDWGQFDNAEQPDEEGLKTIKIVLDEQVYESWLMWKKKCTEILNYDSNAKCFEFAIIEALNIPKESLVK